MMNDGDKKDNSTNANGTKKKVIFKRGKTFCKQED